MEKVLSNKKKGELSTMASLKADLKDAEKKAIMEALCRCFYAEPKPEEEGLFVQNLLSRGKRDGVHASMLLDNQLCQREIYYAYTGAPSEEPLLAVTIKRVYQAGNSIHEKWQRLFLRGGLASINDLDKPMRKGIVTYTPDAIVTINHEKYIVEIKSMNKTNYENYEEHPTAHSQAQLYMHLSGIHKSFVLCENKNNGEFRVELEEYEEDDRGFDEVVAEIKKLDSPPLVGMTKSRCQRCAYQKVCSGRQ